MPGDKRNFETSCIIYVPKAELFPQQQGPLCYYYSLMRTMQFQESKYSDRIPEHCRKIVEEIMNEHAINPAMNSVNIDTKIDDIFYKHITEELIANYCNDAEILLSKKEQFMETYTHSQALGLLLQFKILKNQFFDKIKIQQLAELLRIHGPIPVDGNFACSLNEKDMPDKNKINTENIELWSYDVDNRLDCDNESLSDSDKNQNFQHTILLIGCQDRPIEEVFYIDPNYPNIIFSMAFETFIEKLIYNEVTIYKQNNIKPTIDTMLKQKTAVNDSEFQAASLSSSEKSADSGFVSEFFTSEIKKSSDDRLFKTIEANLNKKRKLNALDIIDEASTKIHKMI